MIMQKITITRHCEIEHKGIFGITSEIVKLAPNDYFLEKENSKWELHKQRQDSVIGFRLIDIVKFVRYFEHYFTIEAIEESENIFNLNQKSNA